MAQSVELLLDADSEAAVVAQWTALWAAGLAREHQPPREPDHRPHLTVYAADTISSGTDAALPELTRDLDLVVQVGAPMLFGPRRGAFILVRNVAMSAELLTLQRRVAELCGADPEGQFGAGRWVPHVTLAHRLSTDLVGAALRTLGTSAGETLVADVRQCRRWDGVRKAAWLL